MDRSYVKDYVVSSFVRNELDVGEYDIEALIDSILFDWNELGSEGDFEALVEWNVDQCLSHSTSDSGKMKRIRVDQAKNFIPYPKDWIDQPTKPDSKYFYMRTLKNGWDEVKYFLDKRCNLKLYPKNIQEQLLV
tara:strand:+ start:72 stop:473 length:402 start_codon:yes stop_codon:yes gene_type:complete